MHLYTVYFLKRNLYFSVLSVVNVNQCAGAGFGAAWLGFLEGPGAGREKPPRRLWYKGWNG
ncbi:hypothetical protein FuraDRAFT_2091 [Pseudogulbenkiania ferrooxidans 2002]|uniref:Uncharacterized protein n=1 Tax=Pseudogulbenkiania ferrooxidans 2002 TaxID=279714 RepID=B9Z406_9NEIS|nr:hypothetical protein FuraDRAFT_2091 [Pseudogulbenkiania ferrooxidans 2002]